MEYHVHNHYKSFEVEKCITNISVSSIGILFSRVQVSIINVACHTMIIPINSIRLGDYVETSSGKGVK